MRRANWAAGVSAAGVRVPRLTEGHLVIEGIGRAAVVNGDVRV